MALERGPRSGFAGRRVGRNGRGGKRNLGVAPVIHFQTRPGHPGFHAPPLTAPARRAGMFRRLRPRQWIVAPLAADTTGAVDQLAFEYEPAAAASAEDHAEHGAGPRAGAIDRLGEGTAVGIVGQAHGLVETALEVAGERLAIEPGGICVLHPAPAGGDRARHTEIGRASCRERGYSVWG